MEERSAPSGDDASAVALLTVHGDPKKARRWRLVAGAAGVLAFVLGIFAEAAEDVFWLAGLFLLAMGGAFAMVFWATRRQRHHTPTPPITGGELARSKAAIVVGSKSKGSVWLVLSEESVYLLGRGLTVRDEVLPYSDVSCVQRYQPRFLGRNQRPWLRLLCGDNRSLVLSIRELDLDPVVEVLATQGVFVHPAVVRCPPNGGLAVERLNELDASDHAACQLHLPQWLKDPAKRHQYRYWDGVSWTNHVSDDGLVGTDGLSAQLRHVQPDRLSNEKRSEVTP
jgi:hypothetical protein